MGVPENAENILEIDMIQPFAILYLFLVVKNRTTVEADC